MVVINTHSGTHVAWRIDLTNLEVTQIGTIPSGNTFSDITFNPLDTTANRVYGITDEGNVVYFDTTGNSTADITLTTEHSGFNAMNYGSQWFR